MRRMRFMCAALFAALLLNVSASARAESPLVLYMEAVMTTDVPALEKLLNDRFVSIDVDGRVMNKRTFLKSLEWGSIQVDRLHLEEARLLHFGNTAIATGTLYFVGRTDGMPVSRPKQRFTLIAEEGRKEGQILLYQATPLRIKSTEPARAGREDAGNREKKR